MKLLFCFGYPKSGTTFLQMLINSHPQMSCPSEHQFDYFIREIPKMLEAYNSILTGVDQRTGQQGAVMMQGEQADQLLIKTVELAALAGAKVKTASWHGVNDNAVLGKLAGYSKLFPQAKFICIVRDPRAAMISAWHHNQRVEPDFLKRAQSLENWASLIGKDWQTNMTVLETLKQTLISEGRLHVVKYEELVDRLIPTLGELFDFVGVDSSEATIDEVARENQIDRLKGNPFFRKGKSNGWKDEMSIEISSRVQAGANPLMAQYGYL